MDKEGKMIIAENEGYKKANILISGKYKSSLMENKILALGMARAFLEDNRAVARITTSELKIMLKSSKDIKYKSGSFYSRLKDIASEMAGRRIYIEDKKSNRFAVYNLVGSAIYDDGIFTLKFEPDLTQYLLDLKNNYTYLNIPVLMSFERNYTYRLYELLKSKAFYSRSSMYDGEEFFANYNVSELKITLGVVDTNAESVSRALKKESPDYDHIVSDIAKEKSFDRWSDFKQRVIDVAVAEINEKSDLEVRYETQRRGVGGKTERIIFYFKTKEPPVSDEYSLLDENNKEIFESQEYEGLVDEVYNLIEEPLKYKEVKSLLSAADGDISRISHVYNLSKQQPNINNLVGWLISAINCKYENKKAAC